MVLQRNKTIPHGTHHSSCAQSCTWLRTTSLSKIEIEVGVASETNQSTNKVQRVLQQTASIKYTWLVYHLGNTAL